MIREAKYDQKTDELGDKNELIDSLEEQNRLLRIRFNRLKGVFGDHRSSKTEAFLKAAKPGFLDGSKPSEADIKKQRTRAHRMSNIEEMMNKKDSLLNM